MLDLHENDNTMNGSVSPPGTFVLRRGLERLRDSAMLKQSLLVFTAGMVLNICGFIAHAVASRQLGVTAYGGLYALINAALICALPAAFVAPVVAQLAAEFRALHDEGHLRGLSDSVADGFTRLGLLYMVVAAFAAGASRALAQIPLTLPVASAEPAAGRTTQPRRLRSFPPTGSPCYSCWTRKDSRARASVTRHA